MPKLWNDTIDAHRMSVRNATLDAAARLVEQYGLASVTMSEIAREAGIGRATLYKYFPDLQSVLAAWHERRIRAHLEQFHRILDDDGSPALDRLGQVLRIYATTSFQHHGGELAAMLHAGDHAMHARQHLSDIITTMIQNAVDAGRIRADVPPAELANFCLSAVEGTANLQSAEAVDRLVVVTMSALNA